MPKKKSRVRKQKKSKSKSRSVNNLRHSLNRRNSSSRKQRIIKKQSITRKKNRRKNKSTNKKQSGKNKSTNKQNGKNKGNKLVRYRDGGGKKRNGIKTMKKKKGKYMLRGGMFRDPGYLFEPENYDDLKAKLLNYESTYTAIIGTSDYIDSVISLKFSIIIQNNITLLQIKSAVLNNVIVLIKEINYDIDLIGLKLYINQYIEELGRRIWVAGGEAPHLTENNRLLYHGFPNVQGKVEDKKWTPAQVFPEDGGVRPSTDPVAQQWVVHNQKLAQNRMLLKQEQITNIAHYLNLTNFNIDVNTGKVDGIKGTDTEGQTFTINECFLCEALKPEGMLLTVADSGHDVYTHGRNAGSQEELSVLLTLIRHQLKYACWTSRIWMNAQTHFPAFAAKIEGSGNIWGETKRPSKMGVGRKSFENIITDCTIMFLQEMAKDNPDFHAYEGHNPLVIGNHVIIDSFYLGYTAQEIKINGGLSEKWDKGNFGKMLTDQEMYNAERLITIASTLKEGDQGFNCYVVPQGQDLLIPLLGSYEFPVYLPHLEQEDVSKDFLYIKIELNIENNFNYYCDEKYIGTFNQSYSGLDMTKELIKHVFGDTEEDIECHALDYNKEELKTLIDKINEDPNIKIPKSGRKAVLIERIQDYFISRRIVQAGFTTKEGDLVVRQLPVEKRQKQNFIIYKSNKDGTADPNGEYVMEIFPMGIDRGNYTGQIDGQTMNILPSPLGCPICQNAYRNKTLPCKEFARIQSLKFTGDFSYILDIINVNDRNYQDRCPVPFVSVDQNCINLASLYLYNMTLLQNLENPVYIPVFGFNLTELERQAGATGAFLDKKIAEDVAAHVAAGHREPTDEEKAAVLATLLPAVEQGFEAQAIQSRALWKPITLSCFHIEPQYLHLNYGRQ